MNHLNWDIFSDEQSQGSLWAAIQIAQQLVKMGYSVRVFSDAHRAELFGTSAPMGFLDLEHAKSIVPAGRVIEVWGSQAPAEYQKRLAEIEHHYCFSLDPPHSSRVSWEPLSPLWPAHGHRQVAVQMGSTPRQAGYLKYRPSLERASRLGDLFQQRQALMERFGLQTSVEQSAYVVMFSGNVDVDLLPFVQVLSDTSRPTVLLLHTEASQMALARLFDTTAEGLLPLRAGQLTIVSLPDMTWEEQDQCIGMSDLVVSSELSLCWRACCMGTPLVPCLQGEAQSSLLQWYCQGSVSAPHVLLKNLSSKLLSHVGLAEAWQWYWSCLPDFEDHAHEIRQHISSGPDLVHALIATSETEQADRRLVSPEHA